MKRVVFSVWFLFVIYFLNFETIFCTPHLSKMDKNELNDVTYFYCGDVKKVLLELDLNLIINNFDSTSFKLVEYLKYDKSKFDRCDPRFHYNVVLHLQHHYLNYYYNFPFTHNKFLPYYEFFYIDDWIKSGRIQYWRPYIGVYDKNLTQIVKIEKPNLNPNNYILTTDLKYKICNVLKMYVNKK